MLRDLEDLRLTLANRIELAIRRAASQMNTEEHRTMLRILADEVANITHDENTDIDILKAYRDGDAKGG